MKTLAIIVNYHSVKLTLQAVRSILDSRAQGPVQVVVVDNTADRSEAQRLEACLPAETCLIVNRCNIGFGRACNLAFERFGGDCLLLLNPDARLLPGCLIRLQQTLTGQADIGAVGPQIFWDDNARFLLPPSSPAPLFFTAPLLSHLNPRHAVKRLLGRLWRRHAIRVWQAPKPLLVRNLSGGHALLRAEAVRKAGGLFDPRFFLYFEDTDLFLRLGKAGYRLCVDPRAAVVHHYDQCGMQHYERKRRLMGTAQSIFLNKYSHRWDLRLARALSRRLKSPEGRRRPNMHRANFLEPFVLPVPERMRSGWLFEWSPNADFIPTVGHFGQGSRFEFSATAWNLLAPGTYYGRLGRSDRWCGNFQNVTWVVGQGRTDGHGTRPGRPAAGAV